MDEEKMYEYINENCVNKNHPDGCFACEKFIPNENGIMYCALGDDYKKSVNDSKILSNDNYTLPKEVMKCT